MTDYDNSFLKNEWAGKGLDFEYMVRLKDINWINMIDRIDSLLSHFNVRVCSWEIFKDGVKIFSGNSKEDFAQTRIDTDIDFFSFWFLYGEADSQNICLEIDQELIDISLPVDFLYSGVRSLDRERVDWIVSMVSLLACDAKGVVADFGIQGFVNQIVDKNVLLNKWLSGWKKQEDKKQIDYILSVVDEYRLINVKDSD